MKELYQLRRSLHKYPELSGLEFETRKRIQHFFEAYQPDDVLKIGQTGIAFVFEGPQIGKTLMFRAELDALPINEENDLEHVSKVDGVAHVCGHDGHMTILAGLCQKIALDRPQSGRVILLFQPAEETGQGALEMVSSTAFESIEPDFVFALHNVPGFNRNEVLVRNKNFCAASKGLTVTLTGKTAHAAHPELALSPVNAIEQILSSIQKINSNSSVFQQLAFATIIHIQLGEVAFGTTPGYAEIRMTLRSFDNGDMEKLTSIIESSIRDIASQEKLVHEISYSEVFPAVSNSDEAVNYIIEAAKENCLELVKMDQPFRWSEDFGFFTQRYKGGFFGLGSGLDQPALHHPDFDFPDEILEAGIAIFYSIYRKILK
jgi:amidohydrolase